MNSVVNLDFCRSQVAQVPCLDPCNSNFKIQNGAKIINEGRRNASKLPNSCSIGLTSYSSALVSNYCPIGVVVDRSEDKLECIVRSNSGYVEVPKVSKSQRTEIGTNVQQECISRNLQREGCRYHRRRSSSPSVISVTVEKEDKERTVDGNNIVVIGASIVADRSKVPCREFSNVADKEDNGNVDSRSEESISKPLTSNGSVNAQSCENNCPNFYAARIRNQVRKPYPKFKPTCSATSVAIMKRHEGRSRTNSSTRNKLNHRPTSTYWQNRSLKLKQCMVSSFTAAPPPSPTTTSIRCAICRQSVKTSMVFRIRRRPPQQDQNKTMTTTLLCQFCYYEHRSRFGGPTTAATAAAAAAAMKKIHVERVHQQNIEEHRETQEERPFMWSSWSWRRHKCPVCQKNFYHPVNQSSGSQVHSVRRRQRGDRRTPASAQVRPTDFGATAVANGESGVVATTSAALPVNFELEQERNDIDDASKNVSKMKAKSCKHLKSHRSRGEYLMPSTSFDDCNCSPSTMVLHQKFPPHRRSSVPPCNSSSLSLLAAASDPRGESTAEITLVPATSPPLVTRPASSSLIVSTTTTTASTSPPSHHHQVHRSTLGLRSSLDTSLSLLPLDTCLLGSSRGAETAVITLVSKDDPQQHHQRLQRGASASTTSLLNKTSDRRHHHHHCRYHRPGGLFRSAPSLVLNKDGTILHPITHIIPPSSPAGSQIEISRAITNYWGQNKAATSEEGLLKGHATSNKDGVISLIASQSSDDSSGGGDTITHVTIMVGQLQPQRALTTEILPLSY